MSPELPPIAVQYTGHVIQTGTRDNNLRPFTVPLNKERVKLSSLVSNPV